MPSWAWNDMHDISVATEQPSSTEEEEKLVNWTWVEIFLYYCFLHHKALNAQDVFRGGLSKMYELISGSQIKVINVGGIDTPKIPSQGWSGVVCPSMPEKQRGSLLQPTVNTTDSWVCVWTPIQPWLNSLHPNVGSKVMSILRTQVLCGWSYPAPDLWCPCSSPAGRPLSWWPVLQTHSAGRADRKIQRCNLVVLAL